jgi:hypothetical protein
VIRGNLSFEPEQERKLITTNRRRQSILLQAGDKEGGEPDDEVLAELMLVVVEQAHAADVQAAERARPPAPRQPPVNAVPVEGVAARQPPHLLPIAARRYAHDAALLHGRAVVLFPAAAPPPAVFVFVGDLDAGESRGEQRHHLAHRHHHASYKGATQVTCG